MNIYTKNPTPQETLQLKFQLQAIAITISSIYILPNHQLKIDKLPLSFIIQVNFNVHNNL